MGEESLFGHFSAIPWPQAGLNGLTYVVPKGSTDKVRIYDTDDLEQFADGRDMNEFDVSYADLEEV